MNERHEEAVSAQEQSHRDRLAAILTDRQRGAGVKFERTRRITGYLVGTLDRFNNAKCSEERERVKHG